MYFPCEEDGVSVSMCVAGAQACMPAGVHALYIHCPRELLTSPTAPFAQPPCVFLEDPWTWPWKERGDGTRAEA